MARSRQLLCLFYALVSLAGLFATWRENITYFDSIGGGTTLFDALARYVMDSRVTPAARAITIDLLMAGVAIAAFMVMESRRLGIRFVWAYILVGFLTAASITFPLFMIVRERHLAWHEGSDRENGLSLSDGVGIAAVSAIMVGLSAIVIGR